MSRSTPWSGSRSPSMLVAAGAVLVALLLTGGALPRAAASPTVDELRAATLDASELGAGFQTSSEFALREIVGFTRNLDRQPAVTSIETSPTATLVTLSLRSGDGASPERLAEDYLRGPTAPLSHRTAAVVSRPAPPGFGPDAIALLLGFPNPDAPNRDASQPARAVLVWRSGDVVALVSYLHWGSAGDAEAANQRNSELQRDKIAHVLGFTPAPAAAPSPPPTPSPTPEPAPPEE